ncbi:alpha/beta fold hydrolase [Legionella sp. km772]|uniref:alpha/beta fold hydrolase n=1 Tax=Legionella sp. km772 TaxID=2498111 RepID=UPI000F8C7095|nr:alpha/beta hydrolase [Legionella sp. km772]RUR12624.1 alpha/beta fold hydrolase [Legionella sp. km772]
MASLMINGANFYYELHGKGKPLVLISGYTCDHSVWNLMLDQLAKKFQVLIFDNRAVGQTTDDKRPFSLEMMAEDTIQLIQKLGLEKPHILGQSMGGVIAQLLARTYSAQLDKLIILNSVAKFNARSNFICKAFLTARKNGVDIASLIDLSLPCFFGTGFLENKEQCAEFKKNLLAYPFAQTVFDQERQLMNLAAFDSSPWLQELNIPTLVISAIEDIITLPEESKRLAEGINNAQFASIDGGHSSPIEASAQVNQHLMEFLL